MSQKFIVNQDINNLNNGSLIKILSSDDSTKKFNDNLLKKLSDFIIRNRVKILRSFIIITVLLLFLYITKRQNNKVTSTSEKIFRSPDLRETIYYGINNENNKKQLVAHIRQKGSDIKKKIFKLLENPDFNVTLKSLTEDGIIELLTYLVDKNHDIHDNILELLTNSYFNKTLSVFPDYAIIKLIKSLVDKNDDIHPNILILLETYSFNVVLAQLQNNGIELINYLIEIDDDIDNSIANLFKSRVFYQIHTLLPDNEFKELVENLIKNKNVINRNNVQLLQKDYLIIYLLLRFSKEDRSNFLNNLFVKKIDIKDNIYYLLTSYDFPKILDLLSDDNTKTLFNDLINREVDIHPNILKLLSSDVFYKIIESFSQDNIKEIINKILDRKSDINKNALELFNFVCYEITELLPQDNRKEIINKFLDRKSDINKNALELLSNLDNTIKSHLGIKYLEIFHFCLDLKKDIQNSNINTERPHEIFKNKNIIFNRILKSIPVDDCIELIKSIIKNIDSIKKTNFNILIKAANDPNKTLTMDEIYNILQIHRTTQTEVSTIEEGKSNTLEQTPNNIT